MNEADKGKTTLTVATVREAPVDSLVMACMSIPLHPNGQPLVTTDMKIACIGEFYWDEDAPYYDEHGEIHEHTQRNAVPWTLCKEIYKAMATEAAKEVPQIDWKARAEAMLNVADYETRKQILEGRWP